MSVRIAPSVLAADFAALGDAVRQIEAAGADQIHVDVMDGHFVPNLTMGPAIVAALKRSTRLPLDVHLMIEEPDRYLETFIRAGAAMVTVHAEVTPHLHRTLHAIRQLGAAAGVAAEPVHAGRSDSRRRRRSRSHPDHVGEPGVQRTVLHSAQPREGGGRARVALRAREPCRSRLTAVSISPTPPSWLATGPARSSPARRCSERSIPRPPSRRCEPPQAPSDPMASATTTIRVRYAETDQMGVVYYANYFVWFEVARASSSATTAGPTARWKARA